MDHRHPNVPSSHHDQHHDHPSTSRRRARSYSQPVASPVPGPSHRPPDPFEFLSNPAYAQGGEPSASSFFPDFEDDALLRSILSMSEEHPGPQTHLQHPFLHHTPQPSIPSMAPPAQMQLPNQQLGNPVLQQAFVSWLQYMQLQMQLQQQQSQPQQPQQHTPLQQQHTQHQHSQQQPQPQSTHAPFPQSSFSMSPIETSAPFSRESLTPERSTRQPTDTPSPDAGDQDMEGTATTIAEEKRRRNTAASARFRVKKKQWTLNLERSITDLSGRVEELEREAAELRRENGWLKEIVMLKSKRFGGQAPNLENAAASASTSGEPQDANSPTEKGGEDEGAGGSSSGGKGKEVQR